ncbi:MAG: radical SAM protein [Candidatus Omnitrophota bacterium]
MDLRQTCIYLTRICPYRCNYCNLCHSNLAKPEMSTEKWLEALRILKKNGISFNLFLGNETWLFKQDLIRIIKETPIPYAMYTSCNPNVFRKYADEMFSNGLDSLSCGCDTIQTEWKDRQNDEERKAFYALQAFLYTRQKYPNVDCQATCTIGGSNVHEVASLVNNFSHIIKMFVGLNYIHANTDGGFDFFPEIAKMRDTGTLLDSQYKFALLGRLHDELYLMLHKHGDHRVQNLEDFLNIPLVFGKTGVTNDLWHCNGNPYGGPTIDADGSLRLCGYRKGTTVSEMSIFDLDSKDGWSEWQRRVKADSAQCPGCVWSYPRLYASLLKNPEFAKKVFNNHAIASLPESEWSTRVVE